MTCLTTRVIDLGDKGRRNPEILTPTLIHTLNLSTQLRLFGYKFCNKTSLVNKVRVAPPKLEACTGINISPVPTVLPKRS